MVGTKGRPKTNVIPDIVDIDVDIRTMPGEHTDEVTEHLRAALGDELFEQAEIEILMDDPASISRTDTPLWDALQRAVNVPFPDARLNPQFTRRFHRLACVPRAGRDLVRGRAVQPVARSGRVQPAIPRSRRARRRREPATHHRALGARDRRPDEFDASERRRDAVELVEWACHHSAKRSWNAASGMPWRAACSTGIVSQPKCSTVTRVSSPTGSKRTCSSVSWSAAKLAVAPREHEPMGRIPDADLADHERVAVRIGLDESAAVARLERERAVAAVRELEQPVRSPPLADLAR